MPIETVYDDLGHPYERAGEVRRIVSLVPSLTEALASADVGALVGVTDWCTHPGSEALAGARRVRGTKNPDVAAIVELAPDLVIANEEENRALDVSRLREAGVPVWVTRTESVPQALSSIRRLFEIVLDWPVPQWLPRAEELWTDQPPGPARVSAVVPIWRDPWMVVGTPTFTADLLARSGIQVIVPQGSGSPRYPHVELAALRASGADLVLLPDEPYVFTSNDGPEAFTDSGIAVRHVSGRHLTWYGPSLVEAHNVVEMQVFNRAPVD